jgi:hypothetical protein
VNGRTKGSKPRLYVWRTPERPKRSGMQLFLPFVWTYVHKKAHQGDEIVEKSTSDVMAGKRHGKAVTLAETYAVRVEQPAQRLYWALVVSQFNSHWVRCRNASLAPAPTQTILYVY